MARQLRVQFPGAIYHVTCRMVGDWKTEKTYLFKDDADRKRFIKRLESRVEQYNIRLYLFVLMSNHFHLVFETPEANCSKFMQSLSTAYTVYYNLRHGRHGHLLDGRYKAKLVDGDEYLLELSRYVHLNPVQIFSQKHKPIEERIKTLRNYQWSSYPGYINKRKAHDFIEYAPLLSEMNGKEKEWPKHYREFVETGLADSDEDFKVAMMLSPRCIGGDNFRAWIDELYQKRLSKHARPEDVSFRRITEPLSVDEVLKVLSGVFDVDVSEFKHRRHNSPLRAVAARYLIRYAGKTQREVADLLNNGSGAAVSKQLKRLSGKLAKNKQLRNHLKQAEDVLETLRCTQRQKQL